MILRERPRGEAADWSPSGWYLATMFWLAPRERTREMMGRSNDSREYTAAAAAASMNENREDDGEKRRDYRDGRERGQTDLDVR